jgi:hypothetical protein
MHIFNIHSKISIKHSKIVGGVSRTIDVPYIEYALSFLKTTKFNTVIPCNFLKY